MFGCDDNGKVFLITTEKSTEPKDGMRGQEMNALMLQYDITNAFQCDGGGSVQSICRNEDGVLDYAQSPYEGGYRPVLTGHFIAMKVEDISLKIEDYDNHNATITVKSQDNQNNDLAIKLTYKHNNQDFEEIIDLDKKTIKLENLYKDTKYNVQVLIKENDKYKELYIKDAFKTLKEYPSINSVIVKSLGDYNYEIVLDINDIDEVVSKASAFVNGKKRSIIFGKDKIIFNFENTDSILDLYFEFNCIFNTENRNVEVHDYKLDVGMDIYIEHITSQVDAFFNFE